MPQLKEPTFYHTKIKDWPEDERPREKLMKHGAGVLSEAELLAILIRTGVKKATAVDIAKRLLSECKNVRELAGKSVNDLKKLGIGEARAVAIVAAFELARRLHSLPEEKRPRVRSPQDAAEIYIPKLRDFKRETFLVILLNSANCIVGERVISEGSLSASIVHPREVFKAAVDELAAGIILVHNHPSGNSEPSKEDIEITKQLVDAGRIMGIPVHDHLIIAGNRYTSLAEKNLMEHS